MRKNELHPKVVKRLDDATIPTEHPHGGAAHGEYNKRPGAVTDETVEAMKRRGINPTRTARELTDEQADKIAKELLDGIRNTKDPYVRWFNKAARTQTQAQMAKTGLMIRIKIHMKNGTRIPTDLLKIAAKAGVKIPGLKTAMVRSGLRYSSAAMKWAGGVYGTVLIQGALAQQQYESDFAVYGEATAKRWRRERTFSIHGGTKEDLDRATEATSNWFYDLPIFK